MAAEQRFRAPREPPSQADGLIFGLGLRPFAVQEAQHLRVPERPARGPARAQAAMATSVSQPADLLDQPRAPHPANPVRDPQVEYGAPDRQADLRGGQYGHVIGQRRTQRRTVELDDLKRPDDPAPIGRQYL